MIRNPKLNTHMACGKPGVQVLKPNQKHVVKGSPLWDYVLVYALHMIYICTPEVSSFWLRAILKSQRCHMYICTASHHDHTYLDWLDNRLCLI